MADLKLKSIQPLFFSPLAIFDVDGAAQLNHQLMAEATAMRAASSGLQRSNIDGWHSENDLFDRKEAGCRALCQHIKAAIEQVTRAVSPQFDFQSVKINHEGWINVLPPGGMNRPHDHQGAVWSGCYYIQTPVGGNDQSGLLEFIDNRTNARFHSVDGAACFDNRFSIKPRPGMLVIFPAYLTHWVYPNNSGKERLSVAFNAGFLPR